MPTITLTDCEQLQEQFKNYCETAEQHEFIMLFVLDVKMKNTIEKYRVSGINQDEALSMFRVILTVIGGELSKYAKVGDKVTIIHMDNPYADYAGRTGVIEHIDDEGQLHGTWGGCALIPGVDKFTVEVK